MTCLVDTNILLRLSQNSHPMRSTAQKALSVLRRQRQDFYIAPQNLNEFYVVATRPHSSNGLGSSCEEAFEEIQEYKQVFTLLSDRPEIFPTWERLIQRYQVMGKQAHDTRLVAAMLVHEISQILTFNIQDFQRFAEIAVINPSSL
ncbi:MAG: type II toxin-antitoxin system VapC family toxin [Phormidesmis sp. CAN_BIN36]|nr:type II toxin-antitoxin system VapC family toxin [Phormidesmis sp. CAN_BIN36]